MKTTQPTSTRFLLIHSDFKNIASECIVAKTNSVDGMIRLLGILCSGDWIYKFKESLIFKDTKEKKEIILNDFEKKEDIKKEISDYLKDMLD